MAAIKQLTKYEFVPQALWGKLPKNWILLLEQSTRLAVEITMLIGSYCVLYATLLGPPNRSEWVYILAAAFCPFSVAIWYLIFPFNPYRSMIAMREGMKNLDQRDHAAQEFAALLRSSEARRFLLGRGGALSVFCCPDGTYFCRHKVAAHLEIWRRLCCSNSISCLCLPFRSVSH